MDVLAYIDAGTRAPALEFVSPIKGPILEKITVEVGSGLRRPRTARRCTTRTSRSKHKQLGLPGW